MADPENTPSQDLTATYQADRFVQDALRVRITPFMLDGFAGEWEDLLRVQNAHALEMDSLRIANRNLSAQVYVFLFLELSCCLGASVLMFLLLDSKSLELSLAQMNEDHVDIVKQLGECFSVVKGS